MARMRMRRMGMKGTREPLLWLRNGMAPIVVTSVAPNPSASTYLGTSLDTGIDAGRTIRRMIISLCVSVITVAGNTALRWVIQLVKRKIGEATSSPLFLAAAGQQADILWHRAGVIAGGAAAGSVGVAPETVVADIKAMRKMTVNDELRLEAAATTPSGGALAVGDNVIFTPIWSCLVQRTRR